MLSKKGEIKSIFYDLQRAATCQKLTRQLACKCFPVFYCTILKKNLHNTKKYWHKLESSVHLPVQSKQEKHEENDLCDIVLVSLFLTLNMLCTLCFNVSIVDFEQVKPCREH